MYTRGIQILSAWFILNMLPGIGSLVHLALGKHAPGLLMLFQPDEIPGIEARALATVDGLATIANTLIATYCLTGLFIVRHSLVRKELWAFNTLALGTLAIQVAAYASDTLFFEGKNLMVIHASSLLLILGFGLCGMGRSRK